MKVSDYIVNFFKTKGINHFFGYQGTMIAHFIDSIEKIDGVYNHVCYNEQGAAFAACGYAKTYGECAVAYSTSGPGALNMISGIADAYYDSVPVIFITGQLNTTEYTEVSKLRQQGFQQTPVTDIVTPITKHAVFIDNPDNIQYELEKAYFIANSGRKGPVVLDIPMNIQRSECQPVRGKTYSDEVEYYDIDKAVSVIEEALQEAQRPILLLGNGIGKSKHMREKLMQLIHSIQLPVLTSLLGSDILPSDDPYNFGCIGSAYGYRYANLIAYQKTDLIISLGCSMCKRQTGMNTLDFAKNAKIIRVDIDNIELQRKVHDDEICFCANANKVIEQLAEKSWEKSWSSWLSCCNLCKKKLGIFDINCPERFPNMILKQLSESFPEDCMITCDVGQHMMWSMHSTQVKNHNRILYSGGHGAMGFALPAAIGAYYASKKRVYCITGDGSIQMNIQELQWIVREKLPITILLMNNSTLGLIRQQQEDFFESLFAGSCESGGYSVPDFIKIAKAYGFQTFELTDTKDISKTVEWLDSIDGPAFLNIHLPVDTKAFPKTYFGEKMINQRPNIPSELLDELLAL